MAKVKIYTGSDHAGFELRGRVVAHLRALGFEVEDLGTPTAESTDYPDWAAAVGRAVRDHRGTVGVLVCGTGLGVCMAANKIHGIRAADAWSVEAARLSRAHNDANVLCVGARLVPEATTFAVIDAWLDTEFEGGGTRAGSTRSWRSKARRQRRRGNRRSKRIGPDDGKQTDDPAADARARTEHLVRQHAAQPAHLRRAGEDDRAGRARDDVEPDHLREGDRLVR